jgi:hypothetical protein
MHHYRQVLARLRQGDSDRDVARSRLMGRPKVAAFRALALAQGWLDPAAVLPDDAALAAAVGRARRARSTISSVEPYRAVVERWLADGVSGVVIHAVLCREHGYRGSYSSVHRMVAALMRSRPPEATVRLDFGPGEAAQVDFGAGPLLTDPRTGQTRRTWGFVMTLCCSRHQYVEFVFDQSVATWLGCHRRAFEWFGGVPGRLLIDNPKCAITRACARDPIVQRASGCLGWQEYACMARPVKRRSSVSRASGRCSGRCPSSLRISVSGPWRACTAMATCSSPRACTPPPSP